MAPPEVTAGQTDREHLLSAPSFTLCPGTSRGAECALSPLPPPPPPIPRVTVPLTSGGFWLMPWPGDFIFITACSAVELNGRVLPP